MSFVLLKNYSHYVIVNDDADFTVGSVHPLNERQGPCRVRALRTKSRMATLLALLPAKKPSGALMLTS